MPVESSGGRARWDALAKALFSTGDRVCCGGGEQANEQANGVSLAVSAEVRIPAAG